MRVAGVVLALLMGSASAAMAAPPSNDDFADAQVLRTGRAVQGTTVEATNEDGEPDHERHTVWFAWTPDRDVDAEAVLAVDTMTAGISVWTGASLGSLEPVAAAETWDADADPVVAFEAAAGTTHWLRVATDDYQSGPPTGAFTLVVDVVRDAHDPDRVYDGSGLRGHDTSRRATATDLWRGRWLPAHAVETGSTADVDACRAGTSSAANQQAVLDRVNYFRAITGVADDVVLDPALSQLAQEAALIMAANSSLSHYPSPEWRCWSEEGADGAANSNLYLGRSGSSSVDGYVADVGVDSVGHRRWVLNPGSRTMGTGDTGSTNALWVVPTGSEGLPAATRERFVAWPPPGHVPINVVYELTPWGDTFGHVEWSFALPGASFDDVAVKVTSRGRTVPVSRLRVLGGGTGGGNTIAFLPDFGLEDALGDTTFRVRVTFTEDGEPQRYVYEVTLVDPTGVARYAGSDRYATSAAMALETWRDGADVVYVATGTNFADGLAAGAAAAPVLLTATDELPEVTRRAIATLRPDRIVVMGGEAAVSDAVRRELADLAPVRRDRGENRFETAAAHATAEWPDGADVVYVATGTAYPDALAAGQADRPILLTERDRLHPATRDAVRALDPDEVVVLGLDAAVADPVVDALADLAPTRRIGGQDRFATAAALARDLWGDDPVDLAYVAVGTNFADGLSAGGGSAPILLTGPTELPTVTADVLRALRPRKIVVLGGPAAVDGAVTAELLGLER